MADTTLFLGEIWTATPDPKTPFTAWTEGGVVVKDGTIAAVGDGRALQAQWPDAKLSRFAGVLMPGFIDTHVHFPQIDMIGSHGEELLGWLGSYTYPTETRYNDRDYAFSRAPRFYEELLAHGTTTAAVYATSQRHTAEALFEEAKAQNLTMVIGKVSMDREGPAALLQETESDARDNLSLIEQYHEYEDRLFCALTPRFAIACSEPLMRSLGSLRKAHPSVYVQTHHAENQDEVAYTKKLFPKAPHYLGVYDQFGLLSDRTILGHSVHITDDEIAMMRERRVNIAHCPTSNAFLGSGLFPWDTVTGAGIPVGLATDVGAGTSLSLWRTMAMAYKLQNLRGHRLSPAQLFYHATLGAAKTLSLDHKLGCLAPGYRADFQIIDPGKHRLLAERFQSARTAEERLFACIIFADDRVTSEVYIAGQGVALPD